MSKFYVINVLDTQYYDDCRIKGSINIPAKNLESFAQSLEKDSTIIVYCASYICHASKDAWHILDRMGFKNIYAYEGGISEWYLRHYPIEGSCTKAQQYIHKEVALKEVPPSDVMVKTITAEKLKQLLEENGLL